MLMGFGKYKGRPVHLLPRRYLKWMLKEVSDLSPQLRTAVEFALEGQEYTPEQQKPNDVTGY